MRIFQADSTPPAGSFSSSFSLGHPTLHQAAFVAALVDRHLTVDTLETILLDLRDAPDHLVAGLAESWLVEIILPELVTFYRETSLHFVSPVEDVLGRHLEDLLLLHAEREGDGASLWEILCKIGLVCCPFVQTFLQVGDLKFQVSDREVRDG